MVESSFTAARFTVSQRLRLFITALGVSCFIVILYLITEGSLLPQPDSTSPTSNRPFHGFTALDKSIYSAFYRWRNKGLGAADIAPASEELVLVTIDDASLNHLKIQWPIPRYIYGELIRRLVKAGATTIGMDILLEDPGPDPSADIQLSQALTAKQLVLPYRLALQQGRFTPVRPYKKLISSWSPKELQTKMGFTVDSRSSYFDTIILKVEHTPVDWKDAPLKDKQGHVIQETFYSFPLIMMAHHLQTTPEQLLHASTLRSFHFLYKGKPIKVIGGNINYLARGVDTENAVSSSLDTTSIDAEKIQWYHRHSEIQPEVTWSGLIRTYTLEEVLNLAEDDLPTLFGSYDDAGRFHPPGRTLVLIGVTATGGYDLKTTPVGKMDGASINLNALINLRLNNFVIPLPPWTHILFITGIGLLLGITGAFLQTSLYVTVIIGILFIIVGNALLAINGMFTGGHLTAVELPLTAPVMTTVLCGIATLSQRAYYLEKRVEKIAEILREVCPIHDWEKILKGQGLELGGEERVLTILFSDLRGFTSFAEKLDSVTVLNTLNQYFGAVGHIFERYGGYVFDYQGDAQMVVFGLHPASEKNHAAAACKAGAAMIVTLNAMREKWLEAGRNVPETGVGICTGSVGFGSLGTKQHKQYVAIGDPTNTASRVQGKSKELDAPVLITKSTFEAAGDEIIAEPLEPVFVKGKRKPLEVYRLKIEEMIEKGMVEVDEDIAQVSLTGSRIVDT